VASPSRSTQPTPTIGPSSTRFKRVVVRRFGGPDVLDIIDEPIPTPQAGQVRVRMLAAGVSYADLLMREGVHPETPNGVFTPGWDVVGTVDAIGQGVRGWSRGQVVAALPITGGYAEYICLPERELIRVPENVNPVDAVALTFNYVVAYQMLHRLANVREGQHVLIHGAGGGIGTALLELGRHAGVTMFGTGRRAACDTVTSFGARFIDYEHQDFVAETLHLAGDGVDAVFDGIGGAHLWQSRRALRPGGLVVAYGLTASLKGGLLVGSARHRFRGLASIALLIGASVLLPGRKRIVLYSIQRLKRRRPDWYRRDLEVLLDFQGRGKLTPLIAATMPLTDARRAHELLGRGKCAARSCWLAIQHQSSRTWRTP
jgi:NADPH:quinone reductase-like Zn-dependent oxidoreductase